MAKNAWMEHLKRFRAAHAGMKNTLVFKEARKTYKKQSGGSALGGSLTPSDFNGEGVGTSGADLQLKATMYGGLGGSKSHSAERSAHKRSAHKRSAHKRSAHKRSAHKRSAHKRSAHKRSAKRS